MGKLATVPGGETIYVGHKPDTGRVLLEDLHIDRSYQRDPSNAKIVQIAQRFEERAAGHLIVSVREDGSMYIMDGQHRYLALKRLARPDVLCEFWYGLSVADEATIFVECNFQRAIPRSAAVYRARLVAKDPIAVDIQSVLDELGLRVVNSVSHNKRLPGGVWAINAVERIYKAGGRDGLVYILGIAHGTWPTEPAGTSAAIMLGLYNFWATYRQRLPKDWYKKLEQYTPRQLERDARTHAELHHTSLNMGMARAILSLFNKGIRNKLTDTFSKSVLVAYVKSDQTQTPMDRANDDGGVGDGLWDGDTDGEMVALSADA